MAQPEENLKKELHKEFQIERMILFSDAVFAIVITLMAIEIHIPESTPIKSAEDLYHALQHLLPTIFAYMVSFTFIGAIWYQHLKIYGLLKAFDGRMVFLNLLLLFFVGLFPFSVTLISHNSAVSMLPFYFYMSIIFCCLGALTMIENYILVKKPQFRNDTDITGILKKYEERKLAMIILCVVIAAIILFNFIFYGTGYEQFSSMLFVLYPVIYFVLKKRREGKLDDGR
ncbi:MAG: DUF1211 domain-containing protein [Bacteroidetes bacterium]|nr:DUF1211 domain-containing protein [Bacteroidota bacterium]